MSATVAPYGASSGWKNLERLQELNGNMTSDGVNSYTWNARNQLASMNLGANTRGGGNIFLPARIAHCKAGAAGVFKCGVAYKQKS